MKFRTYKNTDLRVSEVGFGLWTISTHWWRNFTEGEAMALMRKAFDLGVTLFDAADTYGNGLSEELIAKAFANQRDEIVIATKVGYDFVHHGQARGRGQREIPQDFSPDAVTHATDAALNRLKTDWIDLLQLHNIRMEQVYDDALWTTLEKLKTEGKVRYFGIALGPAIGWLYEGTNCIRERDITSVQHIYNMLEQHPGCAFHQAADDRVASTLPNIYNEEQLIEFAKAPECPSLTADDMAKIDELYSDNFGIEEEPPKFKGTMELPKETAAA